MWRVYREGGIRRTTETSKCACIKNLIPKKRLRSSKSFSVYTSLCGDAGALTFTRDGDIKNPFSHQFPLRQSDREIQFRLVCRSFFIFALTRRKFFFSLEGEKLSRFLISPRFYLPDVSLRFSTKSLPVMSATEFGSMFDKSSKSGSLSIEMLQRFVFICPTSFLRWTFSTSFPSIVSSELWDVIVK